VEQVTVTQLIPVLQTAIGPTILISGVGLLLLSMTNRLGRTIDRARILAGEGPDLAHERRTMVTAQLEILWRRARIIRMGIALAALSALSAAILIIVIFITALARVETAPLISVVFIVCMGCLIGSLIAFIHDINQSLLALKFELDAHRDLSGS